MDILSRRIKELREEHFLSQKALAQRVGVTQKAIDFWEKGQNEPFVFSHADFFQGRLKGALPYRERPLKIPIFQDG